MPDILQAKIRKHNITLYFFLDSLKHKQNGIKLGLGKIISYYGVISQSEKIYILCNSHKSYNLHYGDALENLRNLMLIKRSYCKN